MIKGATYDRIDDAGLHVTVDGQPQVCVRASWGSVRSTGLSFLSDGLCPPPAVPDVDPNPRDASEGKGPQRAPEAVGQAVGGGCRSGWGRLLSVTSAIEHGTWPTPQWAPHTGTTTTSSAHLCYSVVHRGCHSPLGLGTGQHRIWDRCRAGTGAQACDPCVGPCCQPNPKRYIPTPPPPPRTGIPYFPYSTEQWPGQWVLRTIAQK